MIQATVESSNFPGANLNKNDNFFTGSGDWICGFTCRHKVFNEIVLCFIIFLWMWIHSRGVATKSTKIESPQWHMIMIPQYMHNHWSVVLTLEVSHISQHRHCTYTWQHDKCLCTTWCTVEPVDLWPRLMPTREQWSKGYASSWVGLGAERKQFIDDLNGQYICIGFLTIPALQIQVYCTVNTSIQKQKLTQINPEL